MSTTTITRDMQATPGIITARVPHSVHSSHESHPSPEIVVNQWTWKSDAMKRMTLDVCRVALDRGIGGEFSALDLPTHGAEDHGGTGIAGTVFGQLAKANILAPVGGFIDGEFVQRIVRNAHGNRIGVWRLAHPGMARALIRVHDTTPPPGEPVQTEMFEPSQHSNAPSLQHSTSLVPS